MKIILEDGFAVQKGAGIGQHTLNLFHQLRALPEVGSVQLIQKPFLSKVPSADLRRALYIAWLNSGLQLSLRREKADILHCTNYLIPSVRLSSTKYVVTIPDLTAWRFPETLPPSYLSYIKWATSHAVKTADMIFTLSDAIKGEIIGLFNIGSEKIHTVYTGAAEFVRESPKKNPDELATIRDKWGINKELVLCVGTIEKRKNILTVIKAWEKLDGRKNLQLGLVGRSGYGFSELATYLEKRDLKNDVILTGYVSEEEKTALYDLATVLVYPSLYEGFGIPLVEAMSRGTPIVASTIPSSVEVAGDAALYYGNPYDHEALAERIVELLDNDDLRDNLVQKGLERAQEFSWDKIAKRHLQAYHEVLGE